MLRFLVAFAGLGLFGAMTACVSEIPTDNNFPENPDVQNDTTTQTETGPAPKLLLTLPEPGAELLSLPSQFTFAFDQPMRQGRGSVSISSGNHSITTMVPVWTNALTMNLPVIGQPIPGQVYSVQLSDFRSEDGVALDRDSYLTNGAFTFTVIEDPCTTLTATSTATAEPIVVYEGTTLLLTDELDLSGGCSVTGCGFDANQDYTFSSPGTQFLDLIFECNAGTDMRELVVEVKPLPSPLTRTPLVELYTGANCFPCIDGDNHVHGYFTNNGRSHLSYLEWHISIPGYDGWSMSARIDPGNAGGRAGAEWPRASQYSTTGSIGTPSLYVGGTRGRNYNSLENWVNAEAATATDYVMDASASYDGATVSVDVLIHKVSQGSETQYMNVAVVEDDVANQAGYVTYPEVLIFHNVVREYNIRATPISLEQGRNLYGASVTVDSDWLDDANNLRVVAWLQDQPSGLTNPAIQSVEVAVD